MVAGDRGEDAFVVIYERYHQALYRYCRSMLRHDGDAQDALQSAFAGAFAALRRGRRDAPVRPWLFTIVHNEAVSVMRRRRPDAELSDNAQRSTATLEECVEGRERMRLLWADLAELPERQRQTLVLKELNGLSHEDIAAVLGASVGAAKQTLFEARHSLMECVEGRAMACDDVCRAISDDPRYTLRRRRVRAHLRGCGACAAFAAGIETRRADLHAFAPALPAVAATGVLARLLGGGSSHGGGGAGGVASAAAGKTFGLMASAKAAAAIAVLATATAGVATGLRSGSSVSHASPPTRQSSPHVLSSSRSAGGAPTGPPAASAARTTRVRMLTEMPRLNTRPAAHSGAGTGSTAAAAGSSPASGLASPRSVSSSGPGGVSPAAHSQTPPTGTRATHPTGTPAAASTGAHALAPTGTHTVNPAGSRPTTPSRAPVSTTPAAPASTPSPPPPPAEATPTTQPAGTVPTSPVAPTALAPAPAGGRGTPAGSPAGAG
ncbi:MAG TPA: sigma-70 family RNA polymerase sigma factor [Solirubrobacteraceae bacterium]|nr:sigma-70 family RNA polymerase sigma factor [Solirubrobacteraceae bacterium]